MMRGRWLQVALLGAIGGMLLLPTTVSATMHTVYVGNFFFTPSKTIVNQGDTVRWVLDGGIHTTTSDPSSPKIWDSGVIPTGGHYDVVFAAADGLGPFPYHCAVHALSMKDTIFVNPPAVYMCGDPNKDLTVNVGDAVYVINYIFKGGAAPDPLGAGDANCDGGIDVGDAVYIINYVFKGGAAPCCP